MARSETWGKIVSHGARRPKRPQKPRKKQGKAAILTPPSRAEATCVHRLERIKGASEVADCSLRFCSDPWQDLPSDLNCTNTKISNLGGSSRCLGESH